MGFKRCPGATSFSQPKIEMLTCPDCGSDVEIWSDEADGKCRKCGKAVIRTASQSCVDWCKYARDCLGDDKFKQYTNMKAAIRKEVLLRAMDEYFGTDQKRRGHARMATAFAEKLLKEPESAEADPNLVMAAVVLHDIGIKNAEAKHGSSSAEFQELEGPPVAREILERLGYPQGFVNEVCGIIGRHHHPGLDEGVNFRIVYDADLFTNLKESGREPGALSESERGLFLSAAGQRLAAGGRGG